jgi:hypothetical protein
MKKIAFFVFALISSLNLFAQKPDTIKKENLTLVFINKSPGFSPLTRKRLIDAFFTVYPQEIKEYNKESSKLVTFFIDPAYKGVAATADDIVRFNPDWFVKHPEDIDVVTHEVMHIVQNYGNNDVPGWLTEGIADYARYEFGINNLPANWLLPDYKAGQSYTNAYRITARFLAWGVKHKNKKLVKKLDEAMRTNTYKPEMWKKLTGKNVDDLWKEYSENPLI